MQEHKNSYSELSFRLAKARANNTWVDDVKDELCQVLNERKQLVTIFNFNSQRHHGNLEDAILESLFNGKSLRLHRFFDQNIFISLYSGQIFRRFK